MLVMQDEPGRVSDLLRRIEELEARLERHEQVLTVLRESEERLRTLLTNSPDIITVLDPGGRILYVNRTVPTRRVEDVLGKQATDYFPDGEQKRVFSAALEAAVRTREPQIFVAETVSRRIWQTRLVPLVRGESVTAVMGIGTDVTEQRRGEEQLRQAQKMEAVGQLTAGIAHNFNNLLTVIIPSIQHVRRESPDDLRERLSDVEHAARRAAELVKELMVFARHQKAVQRSPIDMLQVVNRTIAICRATFDRTLSMRLVTRGELVPVLADAGAIEQVLLNLSLNARDALEGLGREAPELRFEVDVVSSPGAPGRHVRVRVSDNGRGMPEHVRERIFEPFFTTKEVGRGSGLGLATAYAIVGEHDGRILCESTAGAGTTFTILLPAAETASEG